MRDKTVLITGASSGIGQACAERLSVLGCKLILIARRADRLKEVSDALIATGTRVHSAVLDVRDHAAVDGFVASLPADMANIDILINNAGCALGIETMTDAPLDDWEGMIDTNVKGLLYFIRAVVPGMLGRGSGHVVNIGSTAGHNVYTGGVVYCATKHAVHAISKGLQLEVAGKGIRVTEIDPGMVETEFSIVRFKGDVARAKKVYENVEAPLNAMDIADAIVFALTRPAHVTIGQMLLYSTHQTERLPS